MELALSLSDPSKSFSFLDKTPKLSSKDLGLCMGFRLQGKGGDDIFEGVQACIDGDGKRVSSDGPLQLHLLPNISPVPHLSLCYHNEGPGKVDVKQPFPVVADEAEEGAALSSSLNSVTSSFQMDFGIKNKRGSDDDDNGSTRKKLRLSKEESAFLEESFKEHNTLNPKQKLALAKRLNLRPRQVEVWFQNRRARTKLKQTEVNCEYLKRCYETLTEENRRLQKELQELRVLKASQPFYMHSPATTLTMCPSCERVATTSTTTAATAGSNANGKNGVLSLINTSGW